MAAADARAVRSGQRIQPETTQAGADHAPGFTLTGWRQKDLSAALVMVICADLVRPSLSWLVSGATGKGTLARNMARSRDPDGSPDSRPHATPIPTFER
jgi:hypothetical protein